MVQQFLLKSVKKKFNRVFQQKFQTFSNLARLKENSKLAEE